LARHHTKKRILVVDDERDITITLQVGLEEDAGFDVDAFTDPELALSSFKPDLYHLVRYARYMQCNRGIKNRKYQSLVCFCSFSVEKDL
jgi:DNA-binding response OmpR family regulator